MSTPETVPVPLLDLKAQYSTIREEIGPAIERVVESQRFILGPEVDALEAEVAEYCGCDHAIGVASGTDALLVALMAVGVKPGDEVITTPYSFFAAAGSVARLGADPVFVDIDPHSYNIDPDLIDAAVTERTRAIIPVHLFGQTADMDPIMEVASRHGLYVIEDAAQAIGSEYKGRRAGSIGHLGCFSFFPSKNLGGFGDGGMVTTNDPALAEQVSRLRSHGSGPKYFHNVVGGNFRLDALQAAVLRVKLRHLDDWTEARQQNAATYRRMFIGSDLAVPSDLMEIHEDERQSGQDGGHSTGMLTLPTEAPDRRHIYNQFVVRSRRRDALAQHLAESRIGSEVYYPLPLHLQECFEHLGYGEGALPASECAARETLAIPVYPELTEEMLTAVVAAIEGFETT